jgi:alpha-tubulin suppressor-like RCC1 family protein
LGSGVIAKQVAAGWRHTCALTESGAVKCWGLNAFGDGALGYANLATIGDDETPASYVVELGTNISATLVATGVWNTCIITNTGGVKCWGAGILGYGNTDKIGDGETPAAVGLVPFE